MGKISDGIKKIYSNPKLYNNKENVFDKNQEGNSNSGRTAYTGGGSRTEKGYSDDNTDYGRYRTYEHSGNGTVSERYVSSSSAGHSAYSVSDDGMFAHVGNANAESNYRRRQQSRNENYDDYGSSEYTERINTIKENIDAQNYSVNNNGNGYMFPGVAAIDPVSIKEDIGKLLKEIQSDKIVLFCLDKCPDEYERQEIKLFTAGVVFDRDGQFAEIRKDYYIVIPKNAPINDNLTTYIKNSGLVPDSVRYTY